MSIIGSSSFSSIIQYLNTACSYLNPAYTSAFTFGENLISISPGPAKVNTVIYTSGSYSSCQTITTSAHADASSGGLAPGPAVGVAIVVIFVVVGAFVGTVYSCRKYLSKTTVESSSLIQGRGHDSDVEVSVINPSMNHDSVL